MPAASGQSCKKNKISRDIYEEDESEQRDISEWLVALGARCAQTADRLKSNSSVVFLRVLRAFVAQ
jgi:hypothetical protein